MEAKEIVNIDQYVDQSAGAVEKPNKISFDASSATSLGMFSYMIYEYELKKSYKKYTPEELEELLIGHIKEACKKRKYAIEYHEDSIEDYQMYKFLEDNVNNIIDRLKNSGYNVYDCDHNTDPLGYWHISWPY